ncbi:MAG: hypothetical protein QM725_13775 [Lacibacter sp.]
MATRKRWTKQEEINDSVLRFREKRKWQIALRRYVIERNKNSSYAPYFGLDINGFRSWIEIQFTEGLSWENHGKGWQLDHIIPVAYFNFEDEQELKLCWNFINIRVEPFDESRGRANKLDLLASKAFFEELYNKTGYSICRELLEKLRRIEQTEVINTEKQQKFISTNRAYLDMLSHYSNFEYELLNSGRNRDEVLREIEFFKKYNQ